MPARNNFLNQPAPENYVAGLGRGATGFTTRSDLGPAREGPSEDQIKDALAKRAAQLGAGGSFATDEKKGDDNDNDDNDDRYQDPENEVGLFASGAYDRDDDEADRIYQHVDDRMQRRRRDQRQAREKREREEYEKNNPKIQQQFADLKRALATVSDEDWANIPAVGDLTGKHKRVKRENEANRRFYAVPDSVLAGAYAQGQYDTSIETDAGDTETSGDTKDSSGTDFADIGRARDKVLQVRLDQAASGGETVSGTSTNVNKKGYLTSLNDTGQLPGENNIGDINRARALLESVTKTNPKNAPGWIAAARVESLAGKPVAARNKIAQGCKHCPKSEDAWMENIALNDNANAKIIVAEALKRNDRSIPLWIQAMELENDNRAKKRVMRQALDHVPTSVALWKAAVNLEESEKDARLMLRKATSLIPLSVELWLALARLETPENAQKVLNAARKALPTSHEIWIAGCRLQEQVGKSKGIRGVMKRAIQHLEEAAAMLKRDEWIAEAEKCEDEGAIETCKAIINATIAYDLDPDEDLTTVFKDDATSVLDRGHVATGRAIYDYALQHFPTSSSLWTAAIDLEREHGQKETYLPKLEKATEACPSNATLWMQLAREKWNISIDEGRAVLARASSLNQASEQVWLAAAGLEIEYGYYDAAGVLLAHAREQAGTDRVWIKSATLERVQGHKESALAIVQDALERYPKSAKLYMIKGQIYQFDFDLPQITPAREAYSAGFRANPHSATLWLLASRLEESQDSTVKARSVLERARIACPKNAILWTEAIRMERRAGNYSAAENLMSRAMQDVPPSQSGSLWAERIWHVASRRERRPLALEAVKRVDNDPCLFVCVARILWAERRLDKAATWFEKALILDPDWGDGWAWYLKYLKEYGKKEKIEEVIEKCEVVTPKHGEVWAAIRKDPKNFELSTKGVLERAVDIVE